MIMCPFIVFASPVCAVMYSYIGCWRAARSSSSPYFSIKSLLLSLLDLLASYVWIVREIELVR